MSDLVKRLREACAGGDGCKCTLNEAADRIEQLERELADELEKVAHGVSWDHPARASYRKARGL